MTAFMNKYVYKYLIPWILKTYLKIYIKNDKKIKHLMKEQERINNRVIKVMSTVLTARIQNALNQLEDENEE